MGSVVVLTGSNQYWGTRSLRDVIKMHAKNKIAVKMWDDSMAIRSAGNEMFMDMPLVVELKTFFGCAIKAGKLRYSDDLVYARDENFCQYWHYDEFGRKFKYWCPPDDRTIDHIIPRVHGGKDSFTNCVCACKKCNIERKGCRSVKDARLKLIRKPEAPPEPEGGWMRVQFNFDPQNPAHIAYKKYLNLFAA